MINHQVPKRAKAQNCFLSNKIVSACVSKYDKIGIYQTFQKMFGNVRICSNVAEHLGLSDTTGMWYILDYHDILGLFKIAYMEYIELSTHPQPSNLV